MARSMDLETRFWSKVDTHGWDGELCWEWLASYDSSGYGKLRVGNTMVCAHRIAYSLLVEL